MIYNGVLLIKDNKNELFESIGRGIAIYQEQKEDQLQFSFKLQKEIRASQSSSKKSCKKQ